LQRVVAPGTPRLNGAPPLLDALLLSLELPQALLERVDALGDLVGRHVVFSRTAAEEGRGTISSVAVYKAVRVSGCRGD